MEKCIDFRNNLATGEDFEKAIASVLRKRLPGYEVKRTIQTPGYRDPALCLCDVVIWKDGKVVLGVECKWNETEYRICDYKHTNVPINRSSINTYIGAKFPLYILDRNVWDVEEGRPYFFERIDKVMKSEYENRSVCYKDTGICNYNAESWLRSTDYRVIIDKIVELVESEG